MISAEKKVSPSIAAAASIQMKYFGKNPTSKTLKEIKDEVVTDYEHLPAIEVGFLFMLLEGWFARHQEELLEALQ